MSFLDRFKTQPKYRHPDPAIRLAGVAELPDDAEHWGVIAELAASDEDVRVRRAALERIGVVGYLARIARTERDESLRRELVAEVSARHPGRVVQLRPFDEPFYDGIRSAIYNAFPEEGVDALVAFMQEFEKKNG